MANLNHIANEIVGKLQRANARLLCIDFDSTLLAIHTQGKWDKSATELTPHVRELFRHLVPMTYQANINVAVVTFSPQVALIRQVLELCFGEDLARSIIVRGDDSSSSVTLPQASAFDPVYTNKSLYLDPKCKLRYIASAAMEASSACSRPIMKAQIVLIDDDPVNIRIANDSGIAGIVFETDDISFENLCKRMKQLEFARMDTAYKTPIKRKIRNFTQAFATPDMTSTNRTFPFAKNDAKLCTPSQVLKLKYTVDMGRPRSKRLIRAETLARKIYS